MSSFTSNTGEFRVPSSGKPPSLPAQLTRLVGRDEEIAEVRRYLASSRLLTLTGAGGSGKTRLALEVVARASDDFANGVAWVELAGVTDETNLADHIASAIGSRLDGSVRAEDAIVAALRGQSVLLALDNCEHVVDACAALVELLLRQCPSLRVLATSREALGIAGERSWLVPVLSLPSSASVTAPEALRSAAVELFVERARDVQPSFTLTDANATAVARICRRVDGLPLAIELAAARVRVLSPEQIAKRLDEDFRVLGTGSRKSLPRHRTLHEAIEWSYRLLEEPERVLLERLSAFAGEWSLEAAESIGAGAPLESRDILDVLAALVDKSLVVMREAQGTARYRLLETIREYAAERLAATGSAASVHARHASFYADLLRDVEPEHITARRRESVATVERELDNVHAALTWTRQHDAALHLAMVGRLTWVWYSLGVWAEGRQWLTDALALGEASTPTRERAAALFGAGAFASLQADSARARAWLEECLTICEAVRDHQLAAYARNYLAMAFAGQAPTEGDPHVEAALRWFQGAGDLYGHRLALLLLSTTRLARGDVAGAERLAEEAVGVARAFGLDRELGIALQVLGATIFHRGDLARSEALIRESLGLLLRDPMPVFVARGLDLLGLIACKRGDPLGGARFLGAAEAEREHIGAGLWRLDRDRLASHLDVARRAASPAAFAAAWEDGRRARVTILTAAPLGTPTTPEVEAEAEPLGTPSSPRLRVRALGALEIELDGVVIEPSAWRYSRPRELLLYLLSQPRGRTREQIGLEFWPEASAAQVKNNFHVTLHHVRKVLGSGDWIVFENDRYRLNDRFGVELDADVFEREIAALVRPARGSAGDPANHEKGLRTTLALYRGDFLEDVDAGDWHLERRDHLRRRWVDGMLALGGALDAGGRHVEAAEVYRALVAREEVHEEAYRRLMTSLVNGGQRPEALHAYERLTVLLREELGVEPEPETLAVLALVRRPPEASEHTRVS